MKKIIVAIMMLAALTLSLQSFAKSITKVSGVVNINSASKQELVMIPGIGETKADAIIAFRSEKKFSNTEDLLAINGIGEKLLAKISPYITVSGQTTISKIKVAVDDQESQKKVN